MRDFRIYGEVGFQQGMRDFRIYGEVGFQQDTVNFKKFIREVEERINSDSEIIESAKNCNLEFAKNLKKILDDSENEIFIGSMIADLQHVSRRYRFIKHLEFEGKEYEAQIDELERKFVLLEI